MEYPVMQGSTTGTIGVGPFCSCDGYFYMQDGCLLGIVNVHTIATDFVYAQYESYTQTTTELYIVDKNGLEHSIGQVLLEWHYLHRTDEETYNEIIDAATLTATLFINASFLTPDSITCSVDYHGG